MPPPASERKIPSKCYQWLIRKKVVAAVRQLKARTCKQLCLSLGIEVEELFIFFYFLLCTHLLALKSRTAPEFSTEL